MLFEERLPHTSDCSMVSGKALQRMQRHGPAFATRKGSLRSQSIKWRSHCLAGRTEDLPHTAGQGPVWCQAVCRAVCALTDGNGARKAIFAALLETTISGSCCSHSESWPPSHPYPLQASQGWISFLMSARQDVMLGSKLSLHLSHPTQKSLMRVAAILALCETNIHSVKRLSQVVFVHSCVQAHWRAVLASFACFVKEVRPFSESF